MLGVGFLIFSNACASSSTPAGMTNLGNTCYLNAQLQCQFHIPLVRHLILKDVESGDPSGLKSVFEMLEQSNKGSGRIPANPLLLCRRLGINVYTQQDSQEFWKLLLTTELSTYLPNLVDLYQGACESYIKAQDGSNREKRREETFLDISLEVARTNNDNTCPSVLSAIKDSFGVPELLSKAEGNGWKPEKDAEPVDALKGSTLKEAGLPSILQFHLKRFNYDWQTDTMSKLNDKFEFSEVLDLSSVCEMENSEDGCRSIFDLQSIVVHMGQYGSGHYYSYIRTNPNKRNEKSRWFRLDDERVSEVPFTDVISDCFGGRVHLRKRKRDFFKRMFGLGTHLEFGYGGKSSSAYMLQYIKRSDSDLLYSP